MYFFQSFQPMIIPFIKRDTISISKNVKGLAKQSWVISSSDKQNINSASLDVRIFVTITRDDDLYFHPTKYNTWIFQIHMYKKDTTELFQFSTFMPYFCSKKNKCFTQLLTKRLQGCWLFSSDKHTCTRVKLSYVCATRDF